MEKAINHFLRIVLAISELLKETTGIDPLLSRQTYDYDVSPEGWDYSRIVDETAALRQDMNELDPKRSCYIARILESIEMMTREGLGENLSYEEKVSAYLGIEIDTIPEGVIDKIALELAEHLKDRGYSGELSEAVGRWKEDTTVTGVEELQKTADAFLVRAVNLTKKLVLPVPEELDINITFPKDFPYNGYSESKKNYVSRIMLSGDIGWQKPALKHIVTHEALPGHTLYYATKERLYRAGELPVEGTVYLANTPVSPLAEGLCEIGQMMLGMVEDEDDHIYDLYSRLSSAIITNIAIEYNRKTVDKARAIKEMQKKAFITELHAEKRFGFFSHPLWYISFMHYWFGREIVQKCFTRMKDNLPEFYTMAYLKAQTIGGLQEDVNNYLKYNYMSVGLSNKHSGGSMKC